MWCDVERKERKKKDVLEGEGKAKKEVERGEDKGECRKRRER
jgi:hypothetical protein